MKGIKHGNDVLRGDIGQDVVDLLKYEPSPSAQDIDLLFYVATDLLRRCMGQDIAGIAATTPKGNCLAKIALQAERIHPLARNLHGVNSVQAGSRSSRVKERAGYRRSGA